MLTGDEVASAGTASILGRHKVGCYRHFHFGRTGLTWKLVYIWKLPPFPASRGSARVPLTDRILPSVWLDHPTGLDNLELWHDFNCDGATCIAIFSAVITAIIWITLIKSQLTGRELLRLMCRVRGVAPQVCKNVKIIQMSWRRSKIILPIGKITTAQRCVK